MNHQFRPKGGKIFDVMAIIGAGGVYYGLLFLIGYNLYAAREPIHNKERYYCQAEHVSRFVDGVGEILQISGPVVVEVGWPDPIDPFWPIPPGEARIVSGLPQQFRLSLTASRLREFREGLVAYGDQGVRMDIFKNSAQAEGKYIFYYEGRSGNDRMRVSGTCF